MKNLSEKEEDIFLTLDKYKKILEAKGYKVIYIGLYGSQNYNLDDKESDIDAKAIILPSLHDIIFRKVTSTTIECNEGNIDVKDLITYYDVIKKGNFSFIEAIDTDYWMGDVYIKRLLSRFRPNRKSILGAMYEKRKALTHQYPSKTAEFEKWGCDPKQYHHIIRLSDLLSFRDNPSYFAYPECYAQEMIDIKRNKNNLTKEYMEEHSDKIIEKAKKLIPEDYEYIYENIDNEICEYIEYEIKKELINSNELAKENERLKELYKMTADKLYENGREDLCNYFLAQIKAIPTFDITD